MTLFRVPSRIFKCRMMWVISLVAMVFHLCIWWWEMQALAAQSCCARAVEIKQSWALLWGTVQCSGHQSALWLLGWQAHEGKVSSHLKKSHPSHIQWWWSFCIMLLSFIQLFAVKEIILSLRPERKSPDPCESHWADPDYFLVAFSQPSLKLYWKSLQLFLVTGRCLGLCKTPDSEENFSFPYQNVLCFVWIKYLSNTSLPW